MELSHLDAEIAGIEPRIEAALRAEDVVRGVLALEPLHAEWRRTSDELSALESVPLVHADRDAWRLANRRLRRFERTAKTRKKLRAKLARQLRELPAESAVWKKRAAVAITPHNHDRGRAKVRVQSSRDQRYRRWRQSRPPS